MPLWVDGHLGGFHFLAVVNNTAMSIQVYIFCVAYDFNFFGYIPWSGVAGLYNNIFRNCQRPNFRYFGRRMWVLFKKQRHRSVTALDR